METPTIWLPKMHLPLCQLIHDGPAPTMGSRLIRIQLLSWNKVKIHVAIQCSAPESFFDTATAENPEPFGALLAAGRGLQRQNSCNLHACKTSWTLPATRKSRQGCSEKALQTRPGVWLHMLLLDWQAGRKHSPLTINAMATACAPSTYLARTLRA